MKESKQTTLLAASRWQLLLDGMDSGSECRFLDYKHIIEHNLQQQRAEQWRS